MKTLKKTLCLVLAVVMAVGVLILPANAAYDDFTDAEKINDNFTEAVATLTGMGIISGTSDTTFTPDDTFRRQQAAIMIVNTMVTPDKKAATLAGYGDRFTDIAGSDTYARKEINYLAALGVVSGKTEDKFVPNATLTTYELLTMLRRVAEIKNGYVSGDAEWRAEAMKYAAASDIFTEGLEALFANPDTVPTREQAAQIIWNAINAPSNKGVTGTYDVVITKADGKKETYTGVSLDTAIMLKALAKTDEDVKIVPTGTSGSTIAGQVYNLSSYRRTDDFGRWYFTYTNGQPEGDKNEVVYSKFDDTPIVSGSKIKDTATLVKALGIDTKKVSNIYIRYIVNGEDKTDKPGEDGYSTVPVTDTRYHYGEAGDTVEVYLVDTNTYDILVMSNYVKKIAGDDIKDGKLTLEKDVVVDAADFKADDIVNYHKTEKVGDKASVAADVELLTAQVGQKLTSRGPDQENDPYVNFGSNKAYFGTNVLKDSIANVGDLNFTDAYTIYYNREGYIANVVNETNQPVVVATDYIYVLSYQVKEGSSSDYFAGATSTQVRALVLYMDGRTEMVDIALKTDGGKTYYALPDSTKGTEVQSADGIIQTTGGIVGFNEYALVDGKVALKAITSNCVPNEFSIEKGKATVTLKRGTTEYATKDTKLVVIEPNTAKTSYKATTYTGYTSFAKIASTDVEAALVVNNTNSSVPNTIYVLTKAPVQPDTQTANTYGIFVNKGVETSAGFEYNFVIDGKVVTFTVANTSANETLLGKLNNLTKAGTVMTLTLNSDSTLKDVEAANKAVDGKKVTMFEDGSYIVVETDGIKYLDSSVVFFDAKTGAVVETLTYPSDKTATVTMYEKGGSTNTDYIVIVVIDSIE